MKRKLIYIQAVTLSLLMSCTLGFDDLSENPNKPTQVPPSLLFTHLCKTTFQMEDENPGQISAQFYVNYTSAKLDELTYYWQRWSFGSYESVKQAQQMVEEANKIGAPKYFEGFYYFFKAYHLITLSERLGDIPYSEALKGKEGVYYPKYDSQKDVYLGCLSDLEKANDLIPESGTLSGDIIYNGDLMKWKKLINTYRLKVLMSLSMKVNDPDLKVIDQFQMIYENPTKYPIMTSSDDNAAFNYYDKKGHEYIYYTRTGVPPLRMTNTLGNILKANKDPRLFKFFEIPQQPAGLDPSDFNAYKGMDHAIPESESNQQEKTTASFHSRYWGKAVVEPFLTHSYHELQFILAEAAYRKWISGNPETFYTKGIEESCNFFKVPKDQIITFLQGPVKYDPANGLKQICIQRWIAYFHNSKYDAVWNHRRTRLAGFDPSYKNTELGWPEFQIGPMNRNEGRIPYRYRYPLNELDYNTTNVSNAIRLQWGNDDINHKMWILIP